MPKQELPPKPSKSAIESGPAWLALPESKWLQRLALAATMTMASDQVRPEHPATVTESRVEATDLHLNAPMIFANVDLLQQGGSIEDLSNADITLASERMKAFPLADLVNVLHAQTGIDITVLQNRFSHVGNTFLYSDLSLPTVLTDHKVDQTARQVANDLSQSQELAKTVYLRNGTAYVFVNVPKSLQQAGDRANPAERAAAIDFVTLHEMIHIVSTDVSIKKDRNRGKVLTEPLTYALTTQLWHNPELPWLNQQEYNPDRNAYAELVLGEGLFALGKQFHVPVAELYLTDQASQIESALLTASHGNERVSKLPESVTALAPITDGAQYLEVLSVQLYGLSSDDRRQVIKKINEQNPSYQIVYAEGTKQFGTLVRDHTGKVRNGWLVDLSTEDAQIRSFDDSHDPLSRDTTNAHYEYAPAPAAWTSLSGQELEVELKKF